MDRPTAKSEYYEQENCIRYINEIASRAEELKELEALNEEAEKMAVGQFIICFSPALSIPGGSRKSLERISIGPTPSRSAVAA